MRSWLSLPDDEGHYNDGYGAYPSPRRLWLPRRLPCGQSRYEIDDDTESVAMLALTAMQGATILC
ncbi:hypothetical protein M405DRAFT_826104 [Rhizopogon salebrosus TDB-379]|nr:hypothetical protein M405DRAFT_826104 [Rhizopogon salebrosus TDB-379]